jgi:hypothetical protein
VRYLSHEIQPLLERRELLGLVLADDEGMVLDAVGELYPPEQLAAAFAPLHRLLEDVRRRMNVGGLEEISVRTLEPRLRVIVQSFTVQEERYLIVALYPITTFYRQVTSDIVRIVKDCIRKLTPHPDGGPEPGAAPHSGPGKT